MSKVWNLKQKTLRYISDFVVLFSAFSGLNMDRHNFVYPTGYVHLQLFVYTNVLCLFTIFSGYQYAVDVVKSLIIILALVDRHITVEHAVLLSRLEQEYQVHTGCCHLLHNRQVIGRIILHCSICGCLSLSFSSCSMLQIYSAQYVILLTTIRHDLPHS